MEAVQGPPSPAPSCSGPLLATRSRAVLSIQRRQPSNCSGQKLSCDPGLAGTPPAFSDNCAGDCPHPRSYCFYSRSNAAFWTLQHYLTRSSPPRSGFYHLGASDGGICGGVKFPNPSRVLRQFGGFIPRNRSRKAVAPKSKASECALGFPHHSVPIIPHVLHDWHSKQRPTPLYTKSSTFYRTQSDQVSQTIAWQPLLTNIDL